MGLNEYRKDLEKYRKYRSQLPFYEPEPKEIIEFPKDPIPTLEQLRKERELFDGMTRDEYAEYRRLRRQYESEHFDRKAMIAEIAANKKNYFSNKAMLKIDRVFRHQEIVLVGDKRIPTNKPKIYVPTHTNRYDIEIAAEAIKEPCYLFLGDPKYVYGTFDEKFLNRNGAVFVELNSKTDRQVGEITSVRLLQNGAYIIFFAEGAYNISPYKPVEDLFHGAVRISLKANAEIIPMAIDRRGQTFYVNIG